MLGVKWDQTRVDLKMAGNKKVRPKATNNITVYGLYQVAQNVQGFVSYTNTRNLVTSMGKTPTGLTIVRQQNTLNTLIAGLDFAL